MCEWVKNGYTPPFFKEPTRNVHTKNNKSALMNQEFLESEILEFLRKGIISEVLEAPHIINPLSVVYSKKWRCVFDCRLINSSCEKRSVQLEDLRYVPNLIEKDDFICCEDLKQGYWQVKLQ